MKWEAWDIDMFYEDRMWTAEPASSISILEQGPLRAAIAIERKAMSSTIRQVISLSANSARLEFRTDIDWQERQMLLKVAFPVAVFSPSATYDVQWGQCRTPDPTATPAGTGRASRPAPTNGSIFPRAIMASACSMIANTVTTSPTTSCG